MLVGSVIPMVVEQDGRWERSFDIYSRLLRERIVFLGQEVNDDIANLIAAQLLHLDAQDPGRDISLYVNSPGGSAYAGMAIYDAMQHVKPDVRTVCLGMGMSAAAMILCGGAPGKRILLMTMSQKPMDDGLRRRAYVGLARMMIIMAAIIFGAAVVPSLLAGLGVLRGVLWLLVGCDVLFPAA